MLRSSNPIADLLRLLAIVSLMLISGIVGFFLRDFFVHSARNIEQTKTTDTRKEVPVEQKYFDDFAGVWGNASGSGQIRWKAVDSKYAQRSAPTSITHPLEISKSAKQITLINRNIIKDEFFPQAIDDQIKKYGELIGGFFANNNEYITHSTSFDVDTDGKQEMILETAPFGAHHTPWTGFIIKDNKIILSFPLEHGSIERSKDGNGFYVRHQLYLNNAGACCASGYRLYRVIYENGEFKPVWEQDVTYLKFN